MRVTLAVTALGVVAAALALDFSAFHRFHNADSLIPVLVSLHRWTFYYWEQNRYGMLTPLLAAPAADPVANLLVQNFLTAAAGFAAFPLAARFFGTPRPAAVGLAAAALWALFAPTFLQVVYSGTINVFAASLALGLAGFAAAGARRRWWLRWPLALACFAVGSWVNSALGLLLGPLGLLVPLSQSWRDWPRALGLAALAAAGLAAAMVMQKLAPYPTTHVVAPPVSEWLPLLEFARAHWWHDLRPRPWCLLTGGLLLAAAGQLAVPRLRPEARRGLLVALAVFAGAAAYTAAMMVLFKGRWRYATPALVLVHAAAVCAALRPLAAWAAAAWGDRREPLRAALAGLTLVAAVGLHWGPPRPSQPAADTAVLLGRGVPEIVGANCTHVVGDFWRAWPAMYCADRAYRAAGTPVTIYAISFRSDAVRPMSVAVPREQIRVACFADDAEAAYFRAEFHLPLVLAERRGPVEIWVPAAEPP